MTSDPENPNLADQVSHATSELNNLLQIIAGTNALIAEATAKGESAEKYLAMVRTSIERAEKIAADLALQSGGAAEKSLIHPELRPFVKPGKTEEPSGSKPSILMVDDEQMALTLMKHVLSNAGFNVVTAQSGFECLDHFRKRPHGFDIVLLDLTMPFMDGEETFHRLREIRVDVPILLCTGFIQQDRLKRLVDAGLTGFLRKPIAPDEIVSQVRRTLQSIRYSGGPVTGGRAVVL